MALKVDKSKFTKSFAQRNKLVPLLDREIGKGDFNWSYEYKPKVGDDGWHPSGDCLPSIHDLWLRGQAVPQNESRPFSASLYKTFQVGHFWHAYLQELCLNMDLCDEAAIERKGINRWAEGPYNWATGAGDLAPVDIPGHGEYLVDIKTQNARDYAKNGLPDWCADKYEAQINIYMDFFAIDRAIILCVCKDSPHDFKEITYRRNQPLIDAIYEKWKIAGACITENVEPPVDEVIELRFEGPVMN